MRNDEPSKVTVPSIATMKPAIEIIATSIATEQRYCSISFEKNLWYMTAD
ncbi:MAG: hypothetical protein HOA06_07680 [Chloroflexi bacterium]|jgi:hypothetical protein|nr:hypothetical protein [Chloroflexota bacterium]MBT5476697.1 hypothetical protein [Chloroflexota bacterium]MBT7004584.1 hypothetical protein [Chloroflexota bacterium]